MQPLIVFLWGYSAVNLFLSRLDIILNLLVAVLREINSVPQSTLHCQLCKKWLHAVKIHMTIRAYYLF